MGRHPARRPSVVLAVFMLAASVAAVGLGQAPARATEGPAAGPPATVAGVPPEWSEVFRDDFNGDTLDATKWTPERDSTYGDAHGELACLTDRPENVQVGGGQLQLTA